MNKKDPVDCDCKEKYKDTCRIEAILTVDERGQIVIPKEVRESAKMGPGDRLALISCMKDGEVCCVMLIHADQLTTMVRSALSPVMKEIIGDSGEE
ncbi:MAG: HgcAB-associated protein [Methanomicrobiales archaeon]|nr:HgcAB-associated protein [Methanomicrobiales archaeon]